MSEEPRHGPGPAARPADDRVTPGDDRAAPGTEPSGDRSHGAARSTATVQISVPAGVQAICPECGATGGEHDVTLGLALGPVAEGTRLFLVEPDSGLEDTLEQVRRVMVSSALRRTSGNIAAAAKTLGVKYTTLYSIVHRLGLDDPSLRLTRKGGRREAGQEGTSPAELG